MKEGLAVSHLWQVVEDGDDDDDGQEEPPDAEVVERVDDDKETLQGHRPEEQTVHSFTSLYCTVSVRGSENVGNTL